jgi:hypothetical protein
MNFATLYSQIMETVSNPQPDPGLEARITAALDAALSRKPAPRIPADFAARVLASLPPAAPVRRRVRVGRRVAVAAGVAALAAMAFLAPHMAPSYTNAAFDAELLLCAELAAIGSWLVLRGREI